jgi:hypothetical protein
MLKSPLKVIEGLHDFYPGHTLPSPHIGHTDLIFSLHFLSLFRNSLTYSRDKNGMHTAFYDRRRDDGMHDLEILSK